jgi:hypothetical protein
MSNALSALWARRRAVASGAVITAAAVTVSTLAFFSQGVPTADVKLNDGGVWVTNTAESLLGHLNYPSRVLDGALRSKPGAFDVEQNGNDVLLVDPAGNSLTPIDPAKVAAGSAVSLPAGGRSALGGSTVAIVGAGRLFAVPFTELSGATFDKGSALAKVPGGGSVAASKDGNWVFAVSATTPTFTTVHLGDASNAITTTALQNAPRSADLQLAAIGDNPVAFDPKTGTLYLPDGSRHPIPGAQGGVLQQSSTDADSAYVATASALMRQPMNGSTPQRVAKVAQGTPAAPVVLGGCAYAVWSGSGSLVRECATASDNLKSTIRTASAATLTLRTNRSVVVVNDTAGGAVWLIDSALHKIGNWNDVAPQQEQGDTNTQQSQQQQQQLPPRSAENHPPTAVDHTYGIRPARTTILPVTDGCTDPDGDLLTASVDGSVPAGYTITPVLNGSALQVTAPTDASGTVSFRYKVSDGRGGTADATVTLNVHPLSQNAAPVQVGGAKTIHVEVGASVTYDALDGWQDPDGDDVYLASATVAGGDTLSFRSNGQLVFAALSGQTGTKTVQLGVSDGRLVGAGTLNVVVDPKGSQAPVANSDRAEATAGIPITISPLDNDSSLNGQPLRLSKVDTPPGTAVTPDYANGTIRFSATQAGTYYVQYQVTSGITFANGLIRIDVVAKSTASQPPTAARALALLPVGGTVLVDPLAGDTDPNGGILVLQSVQVPSGLGISAEVLGHGVVRVTDLGQLTAPVQFTYVVSNGTQTATGEIAVMPVPVNADVPPVAVPDTATVQVGQVVTIPVLANDYSPGNGTFTLDGTLTDTHLGKGDVAFVSGSQVRFEAGSTPETAGLNYTIVEGINRASAHVTVHVIASDAAAVQPPTPQPVVARVIAGTPARIPIPLDSIDPNGSTVQLVGVTSSPQKGSVTVGDTWITYTADPSQTGTDTFTYKVRDLLGAEAESTISVGIAAPTATPQQPYAARDAVTVRPGRTVEVDVLANDSDPDGSPLSLVTDGLTVPNGVTASVTNGRVLVHAPQKSGAYALSYTVTNALGATARGSLVVTVDPNAPLLPPIARDDYVSPAQVGANLRVTVPVLANDEDPDGTTSDLKVAVPDGGATVTSRNELSVTLKTDPQLIRYTVTDPDGLVGQAFVFVPGTSTLVPTLISTKQIVVKSGVRVSIPLADYVKVRDEHSPRIATADSVRTGHSDGSNPIANATTLQYTSAKGYYGSDALGVMVTDGTGPDDPKGLSAYVMIPITVVPADNVAPTLRSTTVTVGQGEKASDIDLGLLAFDPNPGDQAKLVYLQPEGVPNGLTAKVSGATLSVSADASVSAGTTGSFTVKVRDTAGATGSGAVTVTVVASTRPLPIAVDIAVPDAQQGTTIVVDPLAQDYNPFALDGKPLSLVSANVASGTGTAAVQNGKVSITPGASFFGTMVVAYTIADATKAASRQATGHITVTVAGKPGQPTVPAVVAFASHTVTLSWQPPDAHGAPITGYTLSWSGGGSGSQQCSGTTCTVTGLTNALTYTFRVVATNKVGDSPASLPSAPVTPDAVPDAPVSPSAVFGDQSLALSWATPHVDGSPVTSYNMQISPAPGGGASLRTGVTGNSLTWTGLTNGVSYQVQVQAVNHAGTSDWSPWSVGTVPAGKPDAPGTPTTTPATPVGSQAQIAVSWAPTANDNGDVVAYYTLFVKQGGSVVRTVPNISGTSQNVTVGTSDTDYTFAVTAHNKAGDSAPSGDSAGRRAAGTPGAPTAVTATPRDGGATVTFTPGATNGNNGYLSYRYRVNQTGATGAIASGGAIGGLTNGTSYTISVWAVSGLPNVSPSAEGVSGAVTPFGKPIVSFTAANSQDNAVQFVWNVNPNGSPITSTNAPVGGTGSLNWTAGGLAPGQSYTLNLSYTNAAGTSTASATGTAFTPSGTVKSGTGVSITGCNTASCAHLYLTTQHLQAGSYEVQCWSNHDTSNTPFYDATISLSPGGQDLPCVFGYPGNQVWVKVVGQFTTPQITW